MNAQRLTAMRRAGFRVLGFGVENFSEPVLKEFNKRQIHRHIEPMLSMALRLGITPFLDLILTSPRSTLLDLTQNVSQAMHWIAAGCEVGIYPYVIPFSGASIARDPELQAHTIHETRTVPGTALSWRQATKILPADAQTRDAILEIEARFEAAQRRVAGQIPHIPSRTRAILWLQAAHEVLTDAGGTLPSPTQLAALTSLRAATRAQKPSLIAATPGEIAIA
jgi:radical SAM superfamily enzyme YgiQ (UPF0313 family)